MYRKFRLLNGADKTYDLADPSVHNVFAHQPEGLGYTRTLSTLRLGNENLITYSMINLDTVNFEILFYDDKLSSKYQKYIEFVDFISVKPLYLLYQTPNTFDWYRKRVESLSLTKTEVAEEDTMLHCDFALQSLSFWESNDINVITGESGLEGGKIYTISYPINYGNKSLSNMPLTSSGLLETPLEIFIGGVCTNPEYVLYDENDEIYGRGKLIGTFDSVYVNSKEIEEDIILIRNELVLDNPLSYQDLTIGSPNEIYITFLKIKEGKSKISFFLGDDFTGTVKVQWRNRYATV